MCFVYVSFFQMKSSEYDESVKCLKSMSGCKLNRVSSERLDHLSGFENLLKYTNTKSIVQTYFRMMPLSLHPPFPKIIFNKRTFEKNVMFNWLQANFANIFFKILLILGLFQFCRGASLLFFFFISFWYYTQKNNKKNWTWWNGHFLTRCCCLFSAE